ncbi:MAG: N-acetylmuramidase domain-containing protein [Pseudomonadota bacterium]|nr:N-acetylmuramidase domain-containing protein [Pseudomonadota bacterium]
MFDLQALDALKEAARAHDCDWRVLAAIAHVESGGRAATVVDGREMPLIRWEGHYFHKLLPREKRKEAVAAGLASPKAGAVPNPSVQSERYRMLARAKAIDHDAAVSSCSWGIGQVMGSHWRLLGYGSPGELEAEACSGAAGQVRLMVRFIEVNGLFDAIRAGNLNAFFRAYNGPGYKRWGYPEAYARAWSKWGSEPLYDMPLGFADLPPEPEPIDAPELVVLDALRENGSRTIAHADSIRRDSLWSRVTTLPAGMSLTSVLYFVRGLPGWLIALVVLGLFALALIFWIEWRQAHAASKVCAARVDDARSGRNVSRLADLRAVLGGGRR